MPDRPLRPAEIEAARRRARDRSLRRDGAILVAMIVALAVTWSLRLAPNEDHPAAITATERLEATYRAVRAGDVELPTAPDAVADGVEGVRFERAGPEQVWVLTAPAGSRCYAMWWDEAGTRRVRTVPSSLACSPSRSLTSSRPDTFDRIGRTAAEDEPTAGWELVLPDPLRHRLWFLPAIILASGIGLSALVRMSIALLTGNAPSATRR